MRPEFGGVPGSALRHEVKYEISSHEFRSIRERLQACMTLDSHAQPAGKYRVHNLYFDTLNDTALWEKETGVDPRFKFRIRCYDDLASGKEYQHLHLEKKFKWNGLGAKVSAPLEMEDVKAILAGEWAGRDFRQSAREWTAEEALLEEFRLLIANRLLFPKVIVDYVREPYVMSLGNVRVTLDYHLRRGLWCDLFPDYDCVTLPALDAPMIMEVKWDEALPGVNDKNGVRFLPPPLVRNLIRVGGGELAVNFSKYAQCRK